jgi:hypothetical protein
MRRYFCCDQIIDFIWSYICSILYKRVEILSSTWMRKSRQVTPALTSQHLGYYRGCKLFVCARPCVSLKARTGIGRENSKRLASRERGVPFGRSRREFPH